MRSTTMSQRIISLAMSASLMMGMCPAPALADVIDGGEEIVATEEAAAKEDESFDATDSTPDQAAIAKEAAPEDGEGSEEAAEESDEDAVEPEDEAAVTAKPEETTSAEEVEVVEPEPTDAPQMAADDQSTGSCGAHATWSYDDVTKTLTISGTGAMTSYETVLNGEERPWEYLSMDKVVIEDGITTIGAYAFHGFESVIFEIPASVTVIGEEAIPASATIRAYNGSYAEEYASAHNIAFESLGQLTIDLSKCTVTLEQTEYEYTGSAIKPAITVTYGDKTLVSGADYGYRYDNNVLPGKATATVTAKAGSGYVGSTTAEFTILPIANEVSLEEETVTLKASATAAQTVDVKASAVGGTLSYYTNKSTVEVTEDGVVTIPAKFVGTVTVAAKATDPDGIYAEAIARLTITVDPVANKITTSANSYTKTASTSPQAFTLGTKRNGSGKITYKSNSSSVKVSSTGKVTIAKNYVGKATIAITVAKQGIYNAATKKVTVTVNPAKVALAKLSNTASNQATVVWKKAAGAAGYQIEYSVNKNFSTAGKTNVSSASTLTKKISSLVKGKKYYVRVRAYKKVSGVTYYGAWSAAKVVSISKGKAITLAGTPKVTSVAIVDSNDVDAMTVKFGGISGATHYQVYYQIIKGNSTSAWKLAGSTTAKSKVVKVKHGKTTFYSFKVRAYKKRADGTTIYSKYSAATNGKALYYTPSVSTLMLDETKTSTTSVVIAVTNKGVLPLRVYSSGAMLLDSDYSSYDRNLKLVDTDALDMGVLRYKSYIDIPAGTTEYLGFTVASGGATWYDKKSTLRFKVRYDDGEYIYRASNYYGTRYYAND